MATKILTAATALLLGLSTVAFAGTPKTDAKTDAKAPAKVEAETATTNDATNLATIADTYYWYDANNGVQLFNGEARESAGCPSGSTPCAYGYLSDNYPGGAPQQKPSQQADVIENTQP